MPSRGVAVPLAAAAVAGVATGETPGGGGAPPRPQGPTRRVVCDLTYPSRSPHDLNRTRFRAFAAASPRVERADDPCAVDCAAAPAAAATIAIAAARARRLT